MVRAGWPYLMIVASLVKKGVEDRRWRGSARGERKNKLKNCTHSVRVATAPRAWVDLLVLSALFLGICSLYFVLVKFAGCTFFFLTRFSSLRRKTNTLDRSIQIHCAEWQKWGDK